jgi:YcxB-like protein
MIPRQFKMTKELVVNAAVLNASRFQIFYVVLAVVVAISTVAFFSLTGKAAWTWERMALQIGLTLAGSLAITVSFLVLLRFVAFPFQARRHFRQQKALSEDMALSWTDEEFLLETGKSQTRMPFADLYGYRTSGEIVLLYLTGALYLLVPVDAFTSLDDHDAFLRKLQDAGVRRL